jgi:hypothetical protein
LVSVRFPPPLIIPPPNRAVFLTIEELVIIELPSLMNIAPPEPWLRPAEFLKSMQLEITGLLSKLYIPPPLNCSATFSVKMQLVIVGLLE